MYPLFKAGDCVSISEVPPGNLKRGDAIAYRSDISPSPIVHRIIAIKSDSFLVRGDNNPSDSVEEVSFSSVLGRVDTLERSGKKRIVSGGRRGIFIARVLARDGVCRRMFRFCYSILRRSGIVRLFWRPSIETIAVSTDGDSVVRIVSSGKTIGKWCQDRGILILRKPWDLVVRAEDVKLK
jgi:hypothetical protein